MKIFAVTGVHHGSIIECKSMREAKIIFKKLYNSEKIICIKDITNSNLYNL